MNIQDFWPTWDELAFLGFSGATSPREADIQKILLMRRGTFRAFAEIEQRRGFLSPELSLDSSRGQDATRLLLMRCLEELLEIRTAQTLPHKAEEGIDALNYALSIPCMEPRATISWVARGITKHFLQGLAERDGTANLSPNDLALFTLLSVEPVLEALRNRPWQNHAQSTWYDGWEGLFRFLGKFWAQLLVFGLYRDWTEFLQYFVAKDHVLQFRIRSRY